MIVIEFFVGLFVLAVLLTLFFGIGYYTGQAIKVDSDEPIIIMIGGWLCILFVVFVLIIPVIIGHAIVQAWIC